MPSFNVLVLSRKGERSLKGGRKDVGFGDFEAFFDEEISELFVREGFLVR